MYGKSALVDGMFICQTVSATAIELKSASELLALIHVKPFTWNKFNTISLSMEEKFSPPYKY